MKRIAMVLLAAAGLGALLTGAMASGAGQAPAVEAKVVVGEGLGPFEYEGDLSTLPIADTTARRPYELPPPAPLLPAPTPGGGGPIDLLVQPLLPSPAPFIPSPIVSFNGMPGGNPPDTNGVIGPNHYIQTINSAYAIWDKTGMLLAGPTAFTTLFAANPATNTPCDNGFTSDPVVLYDPLADRFILTILAFQGFQPPPAPPRTPIPPFYECIAVSRTSNPVNGGWFKYALLADLTSLNDFPKLGVWPDGYYMSANMFPTMGSAFVRAWALDRNSILVGGALHEQHFDVQVGYWSLLPSNMHGTPPPLGEPNVFAAVDFNNNNKVFLWNFHVDWVTPANTTFGVGGGHTPDNTVTVAAYTHLSASIPQPGTNVVFLDALGDRANYAAQYRNINGTESLWLNHPVDTGGNISGIRWYEVRDPSGSPSLFQQGTFNNGGDGVNRWMGSIGADQFGNMLVSYNVSDANSVFPGLRYAGRLFGDPPGVLGQGEGTLIAGTTNIINCAPDPNTMATTCVGRWGDYSGLSVDPVDDCTFWFTGEYVTSNTNRTRIGAVALSGCDADVSVFKSAPSTVAAGTNLEYDITVSNYGPVTAQFVTLNDTTPAGTTFVGLAQTSGPTFACSTPTVGGTGAIQCTVSALPSGDSATFAFVVKVNPGATGNIDQTATVSAYEQDPDTSNNSATVSTIVVQSSDLRITKVCKPDTSPALAGSDVFCTMTVDNLGPSVASMVTITDNIVSNSPFTIGSITPNPSATCSVPPGGPVTSAMLSCTWAAIPPGGSATMTVIFSSNTAGDVDDTASASASTPDPDTSNNQVMGRVTFVSAANLSISKSASPNPVVAGTNLTYVITVSNAGPSVAAGTVVKDTIPGQVSVLTVAPSVGTCTAGIPGNPLQPLTCTLGNLAPSASATVTVVAAVNPSVPDGAVINNNGSVASSVADPDTSNNSVTTGVTVQARADLGITKTSDKATYKPSSVVTYTVAVTNNGPSDALAVIVTDFLPTTQQALYQSDTGGCTKSGLTLTCNLGNMPVGTSRSFTIRELIKGSRGAVSNTASAASSTVDPNSSNNSATRVVTIGH